MKALAMSAQAGPNGNGTGGGGTAGLRADAGAGWLSITWTMLATTAPAIIGSIWRSTCEPTPLALEACCNTACINWAEPNICPSASSPCGAAERAMSGMPNIRAKPVGSRPAPRWMPSVRAGIRASSARAVCSGLRPNCWAIACMPAPPCAWNISIGLNMTPLPRPGRSDRNASS